MNLEGQTIEEIVHHRKKFYDHKNYKQSDRLRDHLDSLNVFCFDHADGTHEVHYYPKSKPMTRKDIEDQMKIDRQANARFDAWLFSNQNINR